MDQVNIPISSDGKPNLNELNEIKNGLESLNNDSDSDNSYSSSDSDKKYFLVKKQKNKENTDCDKLETKIHYMKLDLVNKEIEIEEYKNKCLILSKYEQIFKNIEFLFDRFNNAYTILNERINTKSDNDLFKYIILLENSHSVCIKTKDKYNQYLNNDIIPLFTPQHIYLKNSVIIAFSIKDKEFTDLILKIDKLIFNAKLKQFINHLLITCGFFVIILAIIFNFYFFN
jgi:hypothetical protein